ncbi:FimV/HubP family polar landmark protein [Halomonas mongoliensis]|uniref:FimV/HubP family polar landmark protein n=1 Tax=Halomonas mongoliensis TaxID=321265 RepID=A0ABU1GIX2_9GAMM|nr:FimV/HubP family polar landmark protein [Halomonas mongoliensis]MDR5891963.1 FimV/HubP family polar landmark protein [Halomonas mongoliensis]
MKRKLTLAMLLSLSAASPLALALGLGEADVRSTLNAPLRATIPLTDSAGIQAGLLNVSVADERAFAAAGLPRTPLAASVRLAVDQRQGRLVVDLTTERPVREPWLDLLLRFDWPGGQQLREVTLLLDPPDYDQMPALVSGGRRAAPASAPAAAAEPSRATPSAAAAPRPSASPASSGDPAWVRSGDTLWAVAGRLRPDSGISMNQMMVALVEANPEAFPSGNINAMRAGFTLVVPSREAIAARAGADADRVVAEMNRAWANRGSGAPARVALGSAPAPAAPPPEPVVAAPVAEALPEAPADETGEAAPAAAVPAVDEPVAAAQGPRLTLLTDAQVAAEGEVGGEAGGEAGEGDVEGGAALEIDPDLLDALLGGAPSGDGELSSDERLVRLEARWLESQQTLEAVQEERDELQGELGEMRQQLEALQEQLAALAAGGAGADGPGAGGIATPGSEAEETPWWGAVYQGEVDRNLMLGGAGLAALLALWLVVRRRRREEEGGGATAGAVQVGVPGAQPPVPPQASPAPGAAPAHSIQGSLPQAEAISEADIFIAYGRYDQARELLDTSLTREPERDDLRLKLLTVHLEQGNREEAEQEARRLREGGSPAVREEVERLLERHGVPLPTPAADSSAAQGATPLSQGEKARFGHPAERPPRVFGEGADDAPGQEGAPSAADEPSAAGEPSAADAPPADGGERFAAAPGAGQPTAPEPGASEPGASEPDAPEPHSAEPEASPLPEIATRRLDDGREIIDYRPPSLDDDPAPREETPMQPSVEFTPSRLDEAPEEEPEALPQEWEVEEVSFPPLEADNVGSSSSAATERLAEARRLVDAGEAGRARSLLGELVLSDDPAIHDAAAALLNRLDT